MRRAFNLTERDIRYAMEHSNSNADAARFLRVSREVYKRYAEMYFDNTTGKSLFELHKSTATKTRMKPRNPSHIPRGRHNIIRIIRGEVPQYPAKHLKRRIIKEGIKAERCESCGYDERRPTDYTVPLILVWMDGDKHNHLLENLKLVCFNCFYVHYGDIFLRQSDYNSFKGYNDAII